MTDLTIQTNNHPRQLLYWHNLTPKEQAEFDWLDTDQRREEAEFFRYRGRTYCTQDLTSLERHSVLNTCGGKGPWDGYSGDSFFSGVLVRFVNNGEAIVCATYYS